MRKEASAKKKGLFLISMKEESETVVREFPMVEVKMIADLLGFDLDQDVHFLWFLKQALLTLLPKGWKRESSPTGKVLYHNQNSLATTETHPLLYQFRTAYIKLLKYFLRRKNVGNIFPPFDPEDFERSPSSYEQLQFTSLLSYQFTPAPRLQSALKDAEEFYSSIINYESPAVPQFIEESARYQQASPLDVRDVAKKLGIQSNFKLYWLARLCVALPLPPCWETTIDPYGERRYLTYEYNVITDESPAVSFMQKLVTRIQFGGNFERQTVMLFYDKSLRPYYVDVCALGMGEKGYKLKIEAASPRLEVRTQDLYSLSITPREVIEGMLMIGLANTALVDYAKEIHLLYGISRFVQSCKKQKVFKTWSFRYTLEGESYWYHSTEEKAFNHFPYTKSLFRFIQNKRIRTEKKSNKRIKTYAERHPLFVKYGAGFAHRISQAAITAISEYLIGYLEDEKTEKPSIDLTGMRGEYDLEGEDGLGLLFTDPYKLSNQSVVLDRDDKDVRLSTDSETEKEGGTPTTWETIRRLVFDQDNKPSSSIFQNKKLFKAKIEVKRRVQRSNTFKDHNPEKGFPIAFFDAKRKRSRKSQELVISEQMQDEFANITESSSEDENSSANFESEEEEEASTTKQQEDTPRGTNKTKSDSVKQVQFMEEVEELEGGRKSKRTITGGERMMERTDSVSEVAAVRDGSSHDGKSGISSRASKRQPQSRNTSRPGTGNVLMPGAQPILSPVKKVEMAHHPARLPDNERLNLVLPISPNSELNSQRSSIEEGMSPIFDGKRLPGLSPLQPSIHELSLSSVSSIDMKTSASLIAISTPRNRNEGRAGILPQFPLPPIQLESVGESQTQPRLAGERSEQAVRDKVTREHFGKFSDAVVSSFFDHVNQSPEHLPSDPSLQEVRETEEHDSEVTNWLSSKEVVAGLGHLLMPILRDKASSSVASDPSLPLVPHSPRILPPIVYQQPELHTKETTLAPPKLSILAPQSRRESYIFSEGIAIKAQQALTSKRNSMMVQRPTPASQTEDSKTEGLPQSFVLSPNLKTPVPVFFAPPKRVASAQVVRVQHFLHYLDKVGFPLSTSSEVCHYPVTQEILPQHVRKMGKRLGMRVSAQKYSSAESDLLWIALLQLTAPTPQSFRHALPGQIVMLPFKCHPGDEFFHLMTIFNRKLRAQELDKMITSDKVKNLLDESWLCLVTRMNNPYLYNFLKGERINLKSQPYREQPDLSKDVRITEMRSMLEKQLEEEDA